MSPLGLARQAALFAFLALTAVLAGAQATVSYIHGTVELAQDGGFRELAVGSRLPAEASVRLAPGSVLEIASGELRITLSQPGTYLLPELLRASGEVARWSIGALVRSKVRALFGAPAVRGSTAMGVRAEAMQEDAGFEWMDEEQEALDRGRAALAEERYAEAAQSFREALELAESSSRPEYLFLLGYSLALAGENGAAQQALGRIEHPEALGHYGEYVLLWARLAVDGQGYTLAEELLSGFLADHPDHPASQEALLLAAFCSRQLGRREEAAARLRRVIELDPGTQTAAAARAALSGL